MRNALSATSTPYSVAKGKQPRREQREALGRVDFGAENRAPETTEIRWPVPATGRSARDQAMLMKFGLLAGGALIAIIVVILLINVALRSSPARPRCNSGRTCRRPSPRLKTAQTPVDHRHRCHARQDRAGSWTARELFANSLARGESRTIKKQGVLIITVEDRTKVTDGSERSACSRSRTSRRSRRTTVGLSWTKSRSLRAESNRGAEFRFMRR